MGVGPVTVLVFSFILTVHGEAEARASRAGEAGTGGEGRVSRDNTKAINQSHTGLDSLAPSLLYRVAEGDRLGTLLDSLVATSGGTQVVLLYDLSLPDVVAAVGSWYRRWVAVSVFHFSTSLEWVAEAVILHGRVMEVVVVCTTSHTLHILSQVVAGSLESPWLRWLVVLQNDTAARVVQVVREGTQMAVAVRQDDGGYLLHSSYMAQDNTMTLRKAGHWTWDAREGARINLVSPLHLPLPTLYSDFGGRRLRAAVVNNWPFFGVTTEGGDGSPRQDAGIDVSLLNTLGQFLNFTYEVVVAGDGQWGAILPNGTVTGMMGLVARHQAHLAVNEITITATRETVVDFTRPYFMEPTVLVSKAPAERNRAFAVLSPFTLPLWLLVVAATALMGPVFAGVSWGHARLRGVERRCSLLNFSFNVYRALLNQGIRGVPHDWPLRIVIFSWFFFCFTVYAMYAGTLTAVLARPAYEPPINSLSDLLDAAHSRGFHPVVVLGTSNEYVLREATSGIYRSIWEIFDPSFGYVGSFREGTEKVLAGRYVFLNARLGSEIQAAAKGMHKFHFGRETFYPQGYGIACTSGSPFRMVFEKMLGRIAAAGLVQKWAKDEKAKVTSSQGEEGRRSVAITLSHLQAAFFFLLLGYLLGGLALLLERLRHARLLHGASIPLKRDTTACRRRGCIKKKSSQ